MAYITNEIKTVEGTSISINDSDQKIFDSLELQGDTTQSGTPTPDSPVNVEVVTGRQVIDDVGKNLLLISNDNVYIDKRNNPDISTTYNVINNHVDYVVNSLPQSFSQAGYYYSFKTTIGKTYKVKTKWVNTSSTPIANTRICSDKTGTTVINNMTSETEYSFVSTQETYYFRVWITNKVGSGYVEYSIVSDTDTTYEPYKGQNYEINLGKNLINIDGIYSTSGSSFIRTWEDGVATLTWSEGFTLYLSSNNQTTFTFNPNKTYTLSFEHNGNALYLRTDEGNTNRFSTNTDTEYTKYSYTFTGISSLVLKFVRKDSSGTAYLKNFQLEKGSQATPYSPYKTPIELCKIDTYKDFIRKGTGKNLFDVTSEHTDFNCSSSINNNIITQTNNNPYAYSKWTIKNLKIGQIYSINCNYINKNSCTLRLNIYDSQNNLIIRTDNTTSTSGNLTLSFTANVSTIYIRIYSNNTSNINTNTVIFSDIQLEKNNQVTPYEPYGFKDKWYKYKAIGKVVLDGSENWGRGSSATTRSAYSLNTFTDKLSGASNFLSNNFYYKGNAQTTDLGYAMSFNTGQYSRYLYIQVPTDVVAPGEITNFKTWLSTHNTTVYYVLATPTYTEITDSELIGQLEYIELLEGINNISVSSGNLPAPLKLSYYSTNNPYYNVIYSQDDKNNLKIKFNGVELADASLKCETIKRTARILPDDGSKRFSLDNFISTSLEVVLHNVDIEDIKDQVEIEIGTLIDSTNNTYQYIPLGIFNIQDTPENNNGKVTLKLRDNRVKFDFNYNAKPLMDNNDGTATKGQILDDICSQANVINTVGRFNGDEDLVGIYDNTIQGTTYVSYLMEQAGLIPTIDRLGRLKAIELDKLYVWRIPLSILEGYEMGDPYKIERAVYESGTIKYETSQDETLDTLYLDSANPYISNSSQIDYILNKLQNFEIDSVKTKKVLGNPAIDPYDLIQVYNDLDGTNDVIFTTLANTSYTFNGVHRDNFATQIGKEERTENVSIKGEGTFQKWAKSEIDNVNSKIENQTGEIQTINETLDNTYTKGQVDTLVQTAQTGLTNTFSEAGGNNIFRNTGLWFEQSGGETKTGKNLANFTKETTTSNGVTFSGNGSEISINGTATADTTFILSTTLRDLLNNHLIGKNVTVSCSIASGSVSGTETNKHIRLWFFKTDSWFWKSMDMENATNNVSFTFEEINGVRIVVANGVTATNLKIKVQIEEGSTATEYQPYYTYTNNYEFWEGPVVKQKEEKASNMNALKLQLGNLSQNQIVSSGTYTVSFKYKKLSNLSDVVVKVIINDNEYILNQLTDTEFVTGKKDSEGNYITQPLVVGDNKNIKVEFVTNLNDSCEIYDLMVNAGEVKLAYSQNQNETTTDTVNISKGITITSSDLDVTFKANADGIRTLDKSNNELTKFTDTGMTTKEAIIENTSKIVGLQFQEVNGQTWITRL